LLLFERQKHKNYKHYKNYESILIEGWLMRKAHTKVCLWLGNPI
jgi:hypothetical protein